MNYPSVKTIMAGLGIDVEKARKIRAIMEGPYRDERDTTRMQRIDEVLGTYGVEYQRAGRGRRSPEFWYCAPGDAYAATVLKVNSRFRVGCWGDVVERGNYE